MSKSLFDLIKTLSKAEKRVFSENIKRTKRLQYYKKLMHIYSKSEVYSPELDQKIFRRENPKFIGDCKIKFKDLLHRYLVSLEKNKGLEHQIEQKLKIAQMLFSRKQFVESKKMLKKIDKEANLYELHELIVKIKSLQLDLIMNMSGLSREIDLTYLKGMIADKYKAQDRFVEMQHCYEDGRLKLIETNIDAGLICNKVGKEKLPSDQYKNLRTTFLTGHSRYMGYLMKKNWPSAFDELFNILDLAEKNKKVVLKAKLLGYIHSTYLAAFIELNYMLDKNVNVNKLLHQFDEIIPGSIYEQCTILIDKTVAYSIYALSNNTPQLAVPELKYQETFYKKNNFSQETNFNPYRYYLFIYFAVANWGKCIEYIDKIDKMGGAEWNNSLLQMVRLICIYEQGDRYYFNALIDQHMIKRRKNGVKIKDSSNFTDSVFNVLYYLAKGSKTDLSDPFSKVISTYDYLYMGTRYIIHWIVGNLPKLQNSEYAAFLKQYDYKHYDFKKALAASDWKR